MRFLTLLCLFLWGISSEVSSIEFTSKNIPQYDREAIHCIHFSVSRDAKEGGVLKKDLMQVLAAAFDIATFIETGTYKGDTTKVAAEVFEQVYTIELSRHFFKFAQKRFLKYPNVNCLEGDSAVVLKQLLPKISSRVLFYLDGHYSGGSTAKGNINTPILEELRIIKQSNRHDSVLLIDDIRGFQKSCYPEKIEGTCMADFPDLKTVVQALLQINPDYQICFLGDALLAFPPQEGVSVSEVLAACSLHRLSEWYPFLVEEEQLRQADLTIANADESEKNQIIEYFDAYASFELQVGWPCYAALWHSLVLFEEGNKEEAIPLLKRAIQNSMPDWRASKVWQYYVSL